MTGFQTWSQFLIVGGGVGLDPLVDGMGWFSDEQVAVGGLHNGLLLVKVLELDGSAVESSGVSSF
jgi:hypothetical protein